MNKQFFNAMAMSMLVAFLPSSLFSFGKSSNINKATRKHLVQSQISNLRQGLGTVKLNYTNKENIARYLKDYFNNPEKANLPKLDREENIVAQAVIDSHQAILDAPVAKRKSGKMGNHKKAGKSYLAQAIGTILLYDPASVALNVSRGSEKARKTMRTDPTVDIWRKKSSTGKGPTGLAGQLPSKPLDVKKTTKALSVKKASTVKAKDIQPLKTTAAKKVKPVRGSARPPHYKKSAREALKEAKGHEVKAEKQLLEEKEKNAEKKAKKRAARAARAKKLKGE